MNKSVMAAAVSLVTSHAILAATSHSADAHQPPPVNVHYNVSFEKRGSQIVTIDFTLRGWDAPTLEVHLPVWRPGRYEVIDSAGGVRTFSATDAAGRELAYEKINKASWRIVTERPGDVTVHYEVYANSIANRTRHVDDSHAFLSGASVFMYCHDRRNAPLNVTLKTPAHWNIASGMEQVSPDTLTADTYDTLVDSPIEAGVQTRHNFTVAGVPHEHVFWGRTDVVQDKVIEDTRKITQAQHDLFGAFPYSRYVYITHVGAGLGGGTEHLNSTIMQCKPAVFDDPKAYRNYLSLISHELFHTWNVKQFRPVGLKPYEYQRENYTTLLWVAEGTTSYYDELLCARAGVWTVDQYLTALGEMITTEVARPGADLQSLEESSYDSWIKFNKATPDAVNSTVNFYTRGAVVNFMLDALIRADTGSSKSLDDVMRVLYQRFPLGGPAYSTQNLQSIVSELTGKPCEEFFAKYVRGRAKLDVTQALDVFGLEWSPIDSKKQTGAIGVEVKDLDGAAVVTSVRSDSTAFSAKDNQPGLLPDDQIVAINDIRVRASDFDSRIKALNPGASIQITFFRRERIMTESFIVSRAADKPSLKRIKEPSSAQQQAWKSWLGAKNEVQETPNDANTGS